MLVTPVEKVGVKVDDAPFLAVEMRVEGGEDDRRLSFRTNVDDWTPVDAEHPLRFESGAADGVEALREGARRSVGAGEAGAVLRPRRPRARRGVGDGEGGSACGPRAAVLSHAARRGDRRNLTIPFPGDLTAEAFRRLVARRLPAEAAARRLLTRRLAARQRLPASRPRAGRIRCSPRRGRRRCSRRSSCAKPGLSVLLTQRASHLRAHSGQVAFPGGKIDPGETAAEAALREAQRGNRSRVRVRRAARLARSLSDRHRVPRSRRWSRSSSPGFALSINAREVDEAFETPLAFLMDPPIIGWTSANGRAGCEGSTPCLTKAGISGARPQGSCGTCTKSFSRHEPRRPRDRSRCFSRRSRVYAIYLALRAALAARGRTLDRGRVSLLTVIGLAAAILGLVSRRTCSRPARQGDYVPAHRENGVLVPGRFE